ncbi:MAG: succinate dehydrogenase, partial [Sulfurimonas sp.]
KSAKGLANEQAVRYMCQEAPNAIKWLDGIGVPFSRDSKSKIAQRKLGGTYAARACYAQDYTGLKILHTLYDRCLAEGIEILNERHLLEFITAADKNNRSYVCGVSVLNKRSGEVEIYEAPSIIVATGGYSRVFHKYSTNSVASTGDGVAAALRAGARVSDMEFVQFHPTALKESSILISESARGAGGYLLNSKGERHLGAEFIEKELPQESKLAKLYENADPATDLLPIKPAAHYTMGGIEVDANSSTFINGLFAVGECANHQVHGANRLGGNSLLELVVFGKQAGKNAADYAQNFDNKIDAAEQKTFFENQIAEIKKLPNKISFYEEYAKLGELFYKNVGIKREKSALQSALEKVKEMKNSISQMGVNDKTKVYNTNLLEFLEFKNMLELSETILISALYRAESRGAHFRVDAPNRDEKFTSHTIIDRDGVVKDEN